MSISEPLPSVEGFWLPQDIRARLITPESAYAQLSFCNGRPCQPGDQGAITSRYPIFDSSQWQSLLNMLADNRQRVPTGDEYWQRFQAALKTLGRQFAEPDYPPRQMALGSLPAYTGYSEPMIRMTLNALDMFALEQMPAAFEWQPTWEAARRWQKIPTLPGRIRFYPSPGWHSLWHYLPGMGKQPLFSRAHFPRLATGYGAGNVPGAALLIAFLAQATTLAQASPPPAVVVKNSRREPIFSPLILNAIQAIDPALVANLAVLIWDYEDADLESALLSQADLAIAAASDETIAQIEAQIRLTRTQTGRAARFHAHGHKLSFAAISHEILARRLSDPASGQSLLDIITLLAALDSIFWDQHGCLSARLHFVEQGAGDSYRAVDYAARLTEQLQLLAGILPRGAWPRQQIHDRFDRYKQLEATRLVQVLSSYEDEFLVTVDSRPLDPLALRSLVNDCQGRVIIIRPVASLMDIPNHMLAMLPAANLQSLSIAAGRPGQELDESLLEFAAACGKCGVTAIRTVGRGAFPQLSYSWDGFIPLDLTRQRPAGRFTTIEFDQPYEQILATYHLMQQRGAALGMM